VRHVRTAWIARGFVGLSLFLLGAALYLPPLLIDGWPWGPASVLSGLGWLMAAAGMVVLIVYMGFVYTASKGIPFWSSPLLPLLFVSYAALGGDGVVLLSSPPATDVLAQAELSAAILIAANAVMISLYLMAMARNGGSAGESVRLLSRPPLSWLSWIGVGGVGMLLPLPAIWFAQPIAAGACILIGGLLFRFCLLKAGVYTASALVEEARDLSRLNRTTADFEREYADMLAQRTSRAG